MSDIMQEVTDTVGLRRRIGESFELAALPGTSEEDRRKALHFCVVGGGPTGQLLISRLPFSVEKSCARLGPIASNVHSASLSVSFLLAVEVVARYYDVT